MNITILDNRDVLINSSDNLGTQNENNASVLNFSFPESLVNANKKIVFITDDGNYWDLITNNSYKITNAVTKYKNVSAYVWLVDTENDIDFRSKIWNINFNLNREPDDVVPTEEEISGFDTMITQLNAGLTELQNEKTDLRREYAKVEEGLEDLDTALTEVDNIDIDASKTGSIATVTITNKEGTEKSVEISDGTDYVITQEDYQAIALVVEEDIAGDIPTKTSDLTNDSGFITNTVNNLTNYTIKTSTGSLIDLEMNSSTYVITLSLKDIDGNVISTDTVDLPLESVVVGGSYDSVNEKIVLTLENGNTVDIPVGDLVAGLQTEITSNNKLASDLVDDTNSGNKFVTTSEKNAWNAKLDTSDLADYVTNTDYATGEKGGVIKVGRGSNILSNGVIYANVYNYTGYQAMDNSFFISKGTLEAVVAGKGVVDSTKIKTTEDTTAGNVYDVTYINTMVGDIESILEELDIGGGV